MGQFLSVPLSPLSRERHDNVDICLLSVVISASSQTVSSFIWGGYHCAFGGRSVRQPIASLSVTPCWRGSAKSKQGFFHVVDYHVVYVCLTRTTIRLSYLLHNTRTAKNNSDLSSISSWHFSLGEWEIKNAIYFKKVFEKRKKHASFNYTITFLGPRNRKRKNLAALGLSGHFIENRSSSSVLFSVLLQHKFIDSGWRKFSCQLI